MVMERIPIVASIDELPNAIEFGERAESSRWYIMRRATVLKAFDKIPKHWYDGQPVTASALVAAVDGPGVTADDLTDSVRSSLLDYTSGVTEMDALTASLGEVVWAGHAAEVEFNAVEVVQAFTAAGRLEENEQEEIFEALTAAARYVRTPEGAKFYGQPIGSVIVPNVYLPTGFQNIKDLGVGDFFTLPNDLDIGPEKAGEKLKVTMEPQRHATTMAQSYVVDAMDGDGNEYQLTVPQGTRVKTFKSAPKGSKAVLSDPGMEGAPAKKPLPAPSAKAQLPYDPGLEGDERRAPESSSDDVAFDDMESDVKDSMRNLLTMDEISQLSTEDRDELIDTVKQALSDNLVSARMEQIDDLIEERFESNPDDWSTIRDQWQDVRNDNDLLKIARRKALATEKTDDFEARRAARKADPSMISNRDAAAEAAPKSIVTRPADHADAGAANPTGSIGTTPAPAQQNFIDDRSRSLGTVNPGAKGNDPERFTPKETFADGTTPAKGQKIRDKKGRTGVVQETYQAYTAVRWDDTSKVQTVKNDRLNATGGAAPSIASTDAAGKAGESTKKTIDNSPTTDTGGAAELPDTRKSNPVASLTDGSHELFKDLFDDAPNWSGSPWTDGNIGANTKENRGNLTDLKRKKLITTGVDDGDVYVNFTNKGLAYARAEGWDVDGSGADGWFTSDVEGWVDPSTMTAADITATVKRVKTDPINISSISDRVGSDAKFSYEIKGADGSTVGYIQRGYDSSRMMSNGGRGSYQTGTSIDRRGWLAFDKTGRLMDQTAKTRQYLGYMSHPDIDSALETVKKRFADDAPAPEVTTPAAPAFDVNAVKQGDTVRVNLNDEVREGSRTINQDMMVVNVNGGDKIQVARPNGSLTWINRSEVEGPGTGAAMTQSDLIPRVYDPVYPTGRPMPTRVGDVDTGDIIIMDTRGEGRQYILVEEISDDIKNGQPGFSGRSVKPDGSPDYDNYDKWGYEDQIASIHSKGAAKPAIADNTVSVEPIKYLSNIEARVLSNSLRPFANRAGRAALLKKASVDELQALYASAYNSYLNAGDPSGWEAVLNALRKAILAKGAKPDANGAKYTGQN